MTCVSMFLCIISRVRKLFCWVSGVRRGWGVVTQFPLDRGGSVFGLSLTGQWHHWRLSSSLRGRVTVTKFKFWGSESQWPSSSLRGRVTVTKFKSEEVNHSDQVQVWGASHSYQVQLWGGESQWPSSSLRGRVTVIKFKSEGTSQWPSSSLSHSDRVQVWGRGRSVNKFKSEEGQWLGVQVWGPESQWLISSLKDSTVFDWNSVLSDTTHD